MVEQSYSGSFEQQRETEHSRAQFLTLRSVSFRGLCSGAGRELSEFLRKICVPKGTHLVRCSRDSAGLARNSAGLLFRNCYSTRMLSLRCMHFQLSLLQQSLSFFLNVARLAVLRLLVHNGARCKTQRSQKNKKNMEHHPRSEISPEFLGALSWLRACGSLYSLSRSHSRHPSLWEEGRDERHQSYEPKFVH